MAVSPLVSIGMPVFNCEKTLRATVASILNQDYGNWELIIIDDGSSDMTLDTARSFTDPRIRVVPGAGNLCLPARLNEAVGLSRGKYFARMDGDDISYPTAWVPRSTSWNDIRRSICSEAACLSLPETDILKGGDQRT